MGLMLGAASMLVGLLFADRTLALLGTPANIFADAVAYSRIILIFSPLLFVYLIYATALRGTGDSQTPFFSLIVSTALGVLLTPALIRGWFGLPQLGVASAAWALLISQGIAFLAMLVRLGRMHHPLRFDAETARDMLVNPKILWAVIRIGVPTGLQVIMFALAEIALITFVNHFGSSATAAYGAVNQVVGYVQFPAISIGIAASIFGSPCIGARREDLLKRLVRLGVPFDFALGCPLLRPVPYSPPTPPTVPPC